MSSVTIVRPWSTVLKWTLKLGGSVCSRRWKTQFRVVSALNGQAVEETLARIRSRDGLCDFTPNVEYLVGGSGTGWLDISDKTQLILQSSHPVRYLIEREINEVNSSGPLDLKYLDWVTLFGRSLHTEEQRDEFDKSPEGKLAYENKLANIARAAECGMFSAEVHRTVLNVGGDVSIGKCSDYNLGNKYAVLVGDFFAIKTIFFAEKVKSSAVFLCIINGVEDFTCSSFSSKLEDSDFGNPILPSPGATVQAWMKHAVQASGYFTGGLKAAYTLNALSSRKNCNSGGAELNMFVSQLALFLKVKKELQEFQEGKGRMGLSPFIFVSLPALLYQQLNPRLFSDFRNREYDYQLERMLEVREQIVESNAIPRSQELMKQFAASGIRTIQQLGQNEFYVEAIQELLGNST